MQSKRYHQNLEKIVESLGKLKQENVRVDDLLKYHSKELKSKEVEVTDLQGKLETITTKESNYSSKKEEFRLLLNTKQVLPKNVKEPYAKFNAQQLLDELNKVKNYELCELIQCAIIKAMQWSKTTEK